MPRMLGTPDVYWQEFIRQHPVVPKAIAIKRTRTTKRTVGSRGKTPEQVLRLLLQEYKRQTCDRFATTVKKRMGETANPKWLALSAELVLGGYDPQGYVLYVCRAIRERQNGRMPFPDEVFGARAKEGWLPEYTRNMMQVLPTASIQIPAAIQLRVVAEFNARLRRRRQAYLAMSDAEKNQMLTRGVL